MDLLNLYTGRQLRDDSRDLDAIADGYRSKIPHEYWLADALQKDAIQNSWDAKISKDWKFKIKHLITNKGSFLFIGDKGTSGLIGTIWKSEKELEDILTKNQPSENLAYFLSSNYSAKTSDSAGRRGRGKSLFLIASKDLCFYFDSFRLTDKKYLAGTIYCGSGKSIHVELNENLNYIKEMVSDGIPPLLVSGTRIFIKNPRNEIIDTLKNGALINFVEKTWWEIIKKYSAEIIINDGSEDKNAKLLPWLDIENIKKREGFEIAEFPAFEIEKKLRAKRLVLIYSPNEDILEGIKGISIQRKGMAIERRPTEQLVKEEGMTKVYGWLEMEKTLEDAMYPLEDVEHLNFMWVKKPAKDLLDKIRLKTREFAKKVNLIEAELSKQHKLHKKIQDEVARKINDFLKNLGFTGFGIGTRARKGTTRIPNLPLRISLTDFHLPNSSIKRANHNEIIKAKSRAINELSTLINATHRTWIVDSNGKTIRTQEKDINLQPNENHSQGWDELKIAKGEFPPGDYSFKSKLIILKDTDKELAGRGKIEKGFEIQVSTAFSIEKDPPSQGFIKFEATEKDNKNNYIIARPESNLVIIEYNTKHPYIAELMPPEKTNELERFLFEIGIIVAFNQVFKEDLSLEEPKIFTDLNSDSDPTEIIPRIMEEVSKFMWEIK